MKNPIYVVTDVEVDGPVPGENSMLSFASVAITETGKELGHFQTTLTPLDDANPDPLTMEWFKGQHEAYAAATANPKSPTEAILKYVNWVKSLDGSPIFVAHPLGMDGPWIDYYLRRFANVRLLKGPWVGERLFYAGGMCLRSFAAAKLNWPIWECSSENYSPEWLGNYHHTHKAIEDARGYANLLKFLMNKFQ